MISWVNCGLTAVFLFQAVNGKFVQINQELATSYADKAHFFQATDNKVVPGSILAAVDSYYGSSIDRIECSVTEEKTITGPVSVVLAISKCLNETALSIIDSWVEELKSDQLTYFQAGGLQGTVEFTTTMVPGECTGFSEQNKKGLANTHDDEWEEGYGEQTMASQVLPSDIDRLAAFAKHGKVLSAALNEYEPITTNDVPIAVISFVNDALSYEEVELFERKYQISNTINFQLCQDGTSCKGHFKNCIFLEQNVDLFMYQPFVVVKSFDCAQLTDGIPVSYLDPQNERQCFCSCPAGYKIADDGYGGHKCKEDIPDVCPCVWSTHPYGYKHRVTTQLPMCHFDKIASSWQVPAPFPMDNYVADYRVNSDDQYTVSDGPHVELATARLESPIFKELDILQIIEKFLGNTYSADSLPPSVQDLEDIFSNFPPGVLDMVKGMIINQLGPEYMKGLSREGGDYGVLSTYITPWISSSYSWKHYQQHRQDLVDLLEYKSYGKYMLKLFANDYSKSDSCLGCVAIVDDYRPQHTCECPVHFCDNTTSSCDGYDEATAELTKTNLHEANELVQKFYSFGETAVNDACSIDNRCDEQTYGLKDFFEDSYCRDYPFEEGKTCFNPEEVLNGFEKSPEAKVNPLAYKDRRTRSTNGYNSVVIARQVEEPVPDGQCTRCCSYRTALRELWTDYTCGHGYDLERCSGLDSETCEFNQCLTLFGYSLARASTRIKPDIVEESESVISKLIHKGYNTYTQIHRSLECTEFGGDDGECVFEAHIKDLIETQVHANIEGTYGMSIHDYVFWRYKIEGDEHGWQLFNEPGAQDESLEKYKFTEPETKITVEAWTQCGRVRKFFYYVNLHVNSKINVCDNFDEMWYQTSVTRLPTSEGLCAYPHSEFAELTFDYHPNAGLQYDRNNLRLTSTKVECYLNYKDRAPTEILYVEGESMDIIERFAVELLHLGETQEWTSFHVDCTFHYIGHGNNAVSQTCSKDFSIKDCDGPKIDPTHYDKCLFDDCAGNHLPGPYEACGGNIVKATADRTYMDDEDVECCQSCTDLETTCVPILDLPDRAKDIKRCEPQLSKYSNGYGGYDDGYGGATDTYGGTTDAYGNPTSPGDEYTDFNDFGVEHDNVFSFNFMATEKLVSTEHGRAAVLMAGSALIALVAFVVVRRKRAAEVEKAQIAEDVYYPLLS